MDVPQSRFDFDRWRAAYQVGVLKAIAEMLPRVRRTHSLLSAYRQAH
jgi:hypothetical protein